jgi:hypothetical protein
VRPALGVLLLLVVRPPLGVLVLLLFRPPLGVLVLAAGVGRTGAGVAGLAAAGAAFAGAGLDVLSAGADTQTDAGTMSNANRHANLFLMIFFVDSRDITATS